MTARTTDQSAIGITLALSDDIPATYDVAGYGATTVVFTTVGSIEDVGDEEATKDIAPFTPVATGVKNKLAAGIDYGKRSLVLSYIPGNAGQVILEAAFASTNHYSVKITFPDTEVRYLDVLVTKLGLTGGKSGDVVRRTAEFEICRAPVVSLPA